MCLGVENLFNDRYSTSNSVNKLETLCNAVAAEILVPASLFGKIWNAQSIRATSIDEFIGKVAHYVKCGRIIVARKALDSGRIGQTTYDEIVRDAIQDFHEQKQA
ncbi:MAG: ImmA/IrrE family metallo-endopeptidase [Sphaerochaeta sp.]|uniref:ImmA/IrrE family metallo-endopeptidase n=1 Tax=Sphaerochaeta sp. TaxID=1972642 RepID=UPI003D0EEFEB